MASKRKRKGPRNSFAARLRAARRADGRGYTGDPWLRAINDQAKANRGSEEPWTELEVKVRRRRRR